MTHYTELKEDKGIVLMRGEPKTGVLVRIDSDIVVLSVHTLRNLARHLRPIYNFCLFTNPFSLINRQKLRIQYNTRHSSRIRIDRCSGHHQMSVRGKGVPSRGGRSLFNGGLPMAPLANRTTHASENITFPCVR